MQGCEDARRSTAHCSVLQFPAFIAKFDSAIASKGFPQGSGGNPTRHGQLPAKLLAHAAARLESDREVHKSGRTDLGNLREL
jgi:hypothetical protein